jgi:hypothetical protein
MNMTLRLAAALLLLPAVAAAVEPQPPNVLVILADDLGFGRFPLLIGGGNLEAGERATRDGFEAAVGMFEGDGDGVAVDFGACGQRTADRGDVFAIDVAERPEGEALADVLLVLRMNILRIPEVDGDGHAGLGQRERLQHGFTHAGPTFAGRGEVGELRPREGHFVLPKRAPARDELRELLVVEAGIAVGIAFALIPKHATQRVRHEIDHFAIE